MNWLEAMNQAVEYLESNLTNKIDIEQAARVACSSPYHFQKMYHIITGVTVAEYIRRRRLTLAAQEILAGEKVICVAYKYGYETPEAFTKAFGKLHGVSPSAAREPGVKLKAYPKLSFHISIKGDKDMDYKIVEKGSFPVFGKQTRISMEGGVNFEQVPAFWRQCMGDGSMEWLCANAGEAGVLGICKDFESCTGNGQDTFNYMIAVAGTTETLPDGYMAAQIPAATWAIFESVGALPGAIQELTRQIFTEWLPATGYQHDCAPELEVYPPGDTNSPDYHCQIWVPIKK